MAEAQKIRLSHAIDEGRRSTHRALERLLAPATVVAAPLGAPEPGRVVLVRLCVEDRPEVRLLFLTPVAGGARVASALLKREVQVDDPAAREALGELANIAASSFLNGMAQVANLRLLPTVPVVETTDADALPLYARVGGRGAGAYELPFEIRFADASVRVVFVAVDESLTPDTLVESR